MLREMLSMSPDSRHESSRRRASITSLIISVCVALLFVLGVACSSSPSVEGAGASLSNLLFQVEQTDADLVSASKVTETDSILSTSGGFGPLMTPMMCILGVMCGLREDWHAAQVTLNRPAQDQLYPGPDFRRSRPP